MATQNTRLGIWLMVATTVVFAAQDGISRHLAEQYNVMMVVMIRYWFFGAFAFALVSRTAGGLRAAIRPHHPLLQTARGLMLAGEICIVVVSFILLGLVESHAVFAVYPLLVAALSGPVLGEKVGWRRWIAIAIGFVGVLIILQPGFGVFSPYALIPLFGAFVFALYALLTRYVGRRDSTIVSFFWTGTTGAVAMTVAGVWFWEPMAAPDWVWMGCLCCTGVLGHWLMIRCYEIAEASALQPFAYLQLIFVAVIGVMVFDETIRANVALGAAVVVAAGLFTLWRERQRKAATQTPL